MHALGQFGARPQTRERAERAAGSGGDAVHVAMRVHHRAGAELDVLQPAERADAHAVMQHHAALQHHVDVDFDIRADADRAAHIQPRRIGQAHALAHQRLGLAPLEAALEHGKLQRVVGAVGLAPAQAAGGHRRPAFGRGHGEDVGQVILALGVVVAQPGQPPAQIGGGGADHAGVDARHRALDLVGVLLFNDGLYAAGGIGQHAAVAGRIVESFGQHRGALAGGRQQVVQGRFGDQRHVGVQHQHPGIIRNAGHGLLHGMAGAELLRLFGPVQIRLVGEFGAHLRATVAVHHVDAGGAQASGALDDMTEHRPAGDALQHLRARGLHPLAFAGGQDHDV